MHATVARIEFTQSETVSGERESSEHRRRWLFPAVVVIVYALAAWATLLPFGLLESGRLPVSSSQDVGQQVWWLALALHDLTHGSFSFFTHAIDHPSGVNVLDNGSMPLLGLLMTPFTAAFGPVASYLLLLRIGHLLSACAACWVARRLGLGRLGAAVAGLAYGFGPALGPPTAQHAFIVFAPLPPLMLYLIYRELRAPVVSPHEGKARPPARPLRTGLLLGVLAAAQFLISSEVLVSTLLVGASAVVLAALWSLARRRRFPLAAAARLVAGAAASAVPLLAYPVGYMLLGRAHVSGPVQATGQPGVDLLSILLPTRTTGDHSGGQLLAALWHGWSVGRGVWPTVNLGYLGPLTLAAVAVAVLCRRDRRVQVAALVGFIALLLELGPRLSVGGHLLPLRLPFALLYRIPVLQDAEPSRLTPLVGLAVAILLAVGVDRCVAVIAARSGSWLAPGSASGLDARARLRAAAPALAAGAGLAAIAAGLALAAPASDLTVRPVSPSRSASQAIGRQIPAGAVVLPLPYPSFNHEPAMLLQAQAGFGFDLLGGYAIRPRDRSRHETKTPLLEAPGLITEVLMGYGLDSRQTRAAAAQFPGWIHAHGVTAILAQATAPGAGTLTTLATEAFGQPRTIRGWRLWLT